MDTWGAEMGAGPIGSGAVTLVEGSSFCISAANGDMSTNLPHGLFFRDTRIVSRWDLCIDDRPVEPLAAVTGVPYHATFLGRAPHRWGHADSSMLVRRDRRVGAGLREDLVVENFAREPAGCTITLAVEADFADLFEVKEGRVAGRGDRSARVEGDRIVVDYRWREMHRGVVVQTDAPAIVTRDVITFRVVVPARGRWSATLLAQPVVDGRQIESGFPLGRPLEESEPARRLEEWRRQSPIAAAEAGSLATILKRSQHDLGALRIFDPERPERAVVAAGAPWFMTLFGRDSLLTSCMALPLDQSLALGTLQTLARYQGSKEDPLTEEEPGRILHEVRFGVDTGLALGGGSVYYGTVDATPLFVVLLAELSRWGLAMSDVEALLPHADRALEWMQRYGDRDGDGFVEYQRATDRGLVNQGWKDSWDGVTFADGRLAEPPIALCEVQGYVYSAYLARAHLAERLGQLGAARHWLACATDLKTAFNERFWLPDRGYFAMALDRDKKPVDARASNMGHCLWSEIVDRDKASSVAEHLMAPEMFTGWGVRTLASDMDAYNPASYHNGSVWPHDNAIIAAGLMRYGFVDAAQRVATGLLAAAERFGGRLPELFCGFSRQEYAQPVAYPTSCSPQAWAAATPVQLLRMLLRFDPDIPGKRLWLSPVLPSSLGDLQVHNVPLAGDRVAVDVTSDDFTVGGLPDDIELIRAPRGLDDTSPRPERRP
jgi:glycogen debranching enzyme